MPRVSPPAEAGKKAPARHVSPPRHRDDADDRDPPSAPRPLSAADLLSDVLPLDNGALSDASTVELLLNALSNGERDAVLGMLNALLWEIGPTVRLSGEVGGEWEAFALFMLRLQIRLETIREVHLRVGAARSA